MPAPRSHFSGMTVAILFGGAVILYVAYRFVTQQAAQKQAVTDAAAYQQYAATTSAPSTTGSFAANNQATAPVNAIGTTNPTAFLAGLPSLPNILGLSSAAQGTVTGGMSSTILGPNGGLSPLVISGGGVPSLHG